MHPRFGQNDAANATLESPPPVSPRAAEAFRGVAASFVSDTHFAMGDAAHAGLHAALTRRKDSSGEKIVLRRKRAVEQLADRALLADPAAVGKFVRGQRRRSCSCTRALQAAGDAP